MGTPAEVLRPDLLSTVYRHPVEVLTHPRTGALLVLPDRAPGPRPDHAAAAARSTEAVR
jgi:iron complex transport system ATP-binding protein